MPYPTEHTINLCGRLLRLDRPIVMGIINATPDSFYSKSRVEASHAISQRADEIVSEGGKIIDIGGCSTRPGFSEVDESEEMSRLRVALSSVRRSQPDIPVSVDTYRCDVARMAVEEYGASMVNDVSRGWCTMPPTPLGPDEVPPMFSMVAQLRVPYVLTSHCSTLSGMISDLALAVSQLRSLGVSDIIADPGFGFGKTLEENYSILSHLEELEALGLPLLVGVSRKSMVTRLLENSAEDALNGTTVLHTAALMSGASILRVHDVRQAVEVCKIVEELKQKRAIPI